MILKIGGNRYDFFNQVNVTLNYDSIASTFSFAAYFDPNSAEHKRLFKPLSYSEAIVQEGNERLITGTILSNVFKDNPSKALTSISGYSKTGILADCPLPTSVYPLQSDGLTLREIAEKVIRPFGLGYAISSSVQSEMDKTYETVEAKPDESVESYLKKLASQKGIILSHDEIGQVLFTKARTNQRPIADLTNAKTSASLKVNGQGLHSSLTVLKDASIDESNAGEGSVTNALVGIERPRIEVQTSGNDNDSEDAASILRASELSNIELTIELPRWTINENIIRPNTIIEFRSKELYLYNKTNWFVRSVNLKGNEKEQTATLNCVLPSMFDLSDPLNIFNG
jgi:prophage tail gpP-like protein